MLVTILFRILDLHGQFNVVSYLCIRACHIARVLMMRTFKFERNGPLFLQCPRWPLGSETVRYFASGTWCVTACVCVCVCMCVCGSAVSNV